MKRPIGTFHATDGPDGATPRLPAPRLRLVGLTATALLGLCLVGWISNTTWRRVDSLQSEFLSLRADNFYLGVRVRGDIQRLNDTLLRYRLRGDTNDAESFRLDADEFRQWLSQNTNQSTSAERKFFNDLAGPYEEYLVSSKPILEASLGRWQSTQARDFKSSYQKVQGQSQQLLDLCDSFVANQRAYFAWFLKESNETLTSFKQLLRLSLALILSLAGALVVLVYRGMIAPLRLQLSETHAVLMRQEKLASLGVLAAGVAHEIRNPLTAIKVRLYSLKKDLPAKGAACEDASVIGSEISRLERIVHDFLQFARPSDPNLVPIPAQRILEEVHGLLQPQLRAADIELRLEPSITAWIRADTQQIKQVLINLVQNAADSIGSQGLIRLRIRIPPAQGRRPQTELVSVEVIDNGKGMTAEVQRRLFDPFFTTKEGGTGLGLPIAARIVEKHGGELRYETEPHRGTTFSLILPRIPDHEAQHSPH
jgi:signal transduction histidine kinase